MKAASVWNSIPKWGPSKSSTTLLPSHDQAPPVPPSPTHQDDNASSERDSFDLIEAEIEQLRREVCRLKVHRLENSTAHDTPSAIDLQHLHELNDRLAQAEASAREGDRRPVPLSESFPTLQEPERLGSRTVPAGRSPSYADILAGALTHTLSGTHTGKEGVQTQYLIATPVSASPSKRAVPNGSKKVILKSPPQATSPRKRTRPRSPVFATSQRPFDRQRRASLPSSWMDTSHDLGPALRKSPSKIATTFGAAFANHSSLEKPSHHTSSRPRPSPTKLGGYVGATLASRQRTIAAEHHGANEGLHHSMPASPAKPKQVATLKQTASTIGRQALCPAKTSTGTINDLSTESATAQKTDVTAAASRQSNLTQPPSEFLVREQRPTQAPAHQYQVSDRDGEFLSETPPSLSRIPRLQGKPSKMKLSVATKSPRSHGYRIPQMEGLKPVDPSVLKRPFHPQSSGQSLFDNDAKLSNKHAAATESTDASGDISIPKIRGPVATDMSRNHAASFSNAMTEQPRKTTGQSHMSKLSDTSSTTISGDTAVSSEAVWSTDAPSNRAIHRTVSQATMIRTSLRGDAPSFTPSFPNMHLEGPMIANAAPVLFGPAVFAPTTLAPPLIERYRFSDADIERYWPELDWIRLDPEERESILRLRRQARYKQATSSSTGSVSSMSPQSSWSPLHHRTIKMDPQGNVIYPKTAWAARRAVQQMPFRLGRASMPTSSGGEGKGWTIGSAQPGWWYGWKGGDGKEISFTGHGPDAEKDPNSPVNFRVPQGDTPSTISGTLAGSGASAMLPNRGKLMDTPGVLYEDLRDPVKTESTTATMPCGNYEISTAVEHIGTSGAALNWCHTCRPGH
ncbi:hypothetical protein B9Z65_716 [Elsinoe australis]|uniref:Uncharacterized protein n=1 Tax=Elsinoe australis TaxID=40998 RepID=A0A2P8AJC8_9PEZI|nr:hypothetical protein B9Z65_716 [Elsinoe australis]